MPTAPRLLRYTRVAVVLHWLVAVLMIVNVALILSVDSLPDEWVRPAIDTHKSTGITVLGLALLRVFWRLGHPPPAMPVAYPAWERYSAHFVHGVLYLLILALPISGWLHDSAWKDAATHPMRLFGLVPWPRLGFIQGIEPVARESLHGLFGSIHTAFGYALYVAFALHLAGALKHQFQGEREIQRMSFGGRPPA